MSIYITAIIPELFQPDVVTEVIQINSLMSPPLVPETVCFNDTQCLGDESMGGVLEYEHFAEHLEDRMVRYQRYEDGLKATGSDVMAVFAHTVLIAFQRLCSLKQ